jgi:hypothetical protein
LAYHLIDEVSEYDLDGWLAHDLRRQPPGGATSRT